MRNLIWIKKMHPPAGGKRACCGAILFRAPLGFGRGFRYKSHDARGFRNSRDRRTAGGSQRGRVAYGHPIARLGRPRTARLAGRPSHRVLHARSARSRQPLAHPTAQDAVAQRKRQARGSRAAPRAARGLSPSLSLCPRAAGCTTWAQHR